MRAVTGGSVALFLALAAAWFVAGWIRRRRDDRVGAVAAVLAAVIALGVNQVISHVWSRPRPFVDHPSVHLLLSHGTDPSFPSDHVAAAFAIAVVAVLVRPRLGVPLLALACLVGYSRVYVGAHYPGDVLGGAGVGALVATLIVRPLRMAPEMLTAFGDSILVRIGWLSPTEGRISVGALPQQGGSDEH